ncbi:MAG: peroxidase family protein [Burkholderiaceae bacterium]
MSKYNTSFTINLADLAFMLRQIKIAEASSLAYSPAPVSILQAIMDEYSMSAEAASLSPFGLRTVDGTFNNLLPGQTNYGAADTLFPRLTDPVYINDTDNDTMPLGPPGSGAPTITNNDYGTPGSVADADPRIISNLIVDMSLSNPAAIAAFLSNPLSMEAFVGLTGLPEDDAAAWLIDPDNVVAATELLKTIPNQSPDIGLSPGFNSWMTFFGQFFDHGLDLVTKGGAGTVYIPLQPDDPLYVEGSPTNFMALTRATPTIIDGVAQHENTTTGWIDQNQTYTSHSSHQVFLREYVKDANGDAVSTGRLLDGSAATGSLSGSISNWADVKAQAKEMLGIILTDFDVHNVPLLLTDQYGKFIPGANGFAQVATETGFVEGTADGLSLPANTVRTNHAFLNDIAHHAAPSMVDLDHNPGTPKTAQTADSDIDANGNGVYDEGIDTLTDVNADGVITTADFYAADQNPNGSLNESTYDDEMLNSHFITGDGRGNENIGLTSVHSIFHSEHNRVVEANKATILASGDLAVINEWLVDDITEIPVDTNTLVWDGDRLFQAARFSTEMQYQHMVFEEFARRIQPMVDPFIFTNTADINPSIVAEFAHTVYRFGHSMLTGTVDRLDNNLENVNGEVSQASLLAAFLNPQMYIASGQTAEEANANLIRGLSRDVGSEIDEFIVSDLRSNLVGLPLDLAALNIARGRETGIPSLNETRAQLYAGGAIDLKPYESWVDFSEHIKNPLSIINFIAAYGTHTSILVETTTEGMRLAAENLVNLALNGDDDALDFLNATGIYADGDLGGMNNIDLWIGGLAEAKNEFGGMLGQTFNFIFEYQMESLQDGDRMYYLSRTQGTNLLNQLEPNTFSDMVMRNTDLGDIYSTHLNGFLFVTPDHTFELDRGIAQTDYNGAAAGRDVTWAAGEPHSILQQKVVRSYTPGSTLLDTETGITHDVGGTFKFLGGEHVVVGGTEGNDKIWTDKGIDTLWGDGGNDYLNAGMESDNVFGGDGDDIIEDPFGDDMLRGNAGNDVIASARGFDILFGDSGNDFIMLGQDASEVFAGTGDDFVLGGSGSDALLGNEGNDWIEGGEGFDGLAGENSELFFDSPIIGHDVLNGQGNDTDYDGESGDDIMVQGAGIQRSNGMFGFDWAIHKGDMVAADSDLGIPFFPAQVAFTLRDRFDSVEGLSGWKMNDVLTGAAALRGAAGGAGAGPGNPVNESHLMSQNVGLIDGFAALLGFDTPEELALLASMAIDTTVLDTTLGAEIIIGGAGNDTIKGNLGNDILDGDAWLNVRISVRSATNPAIELFSVDSLNEISARLLSGEINPGQLTIVREILQSNTAATDVDTAVYNGNRSEYSLVRNADGSLTVTHTPVVVGGGGAVIDDGTDTIRNFERLQFTDKNILMTASTATGAAIISDTSPTEGQVLFANTSAIADANGLEAFSFQWQSSLDGDNWTDIAGATDATFVPVDLPGLAAGPQADMQLRAIISFTDSAGFAESITSAPTGYVGTDWDGNGLANSFSGTVGDDIADGNGGDDNMSGNDGNDILNGGTGIDTLNGGNGNDRLDGGAGADIMSGGDGDDTYIVSDVPGDVIEELADEGIDTVQTALTYNLATSANTTNVENLTVTGTAARNLTGNALDNVLTGNTGSNIIDGGTGADTMIGGGGAGNDTYVVDNIGDIVTETGNGTDTVNSSIDFSLNSAGTATVERLTLTGTATNATGNALNNTITGNASSNTIDGGAGADTMVGGNGNDTYIVDNTADVVTETNVVGSGMDTVQSSATNYTITDADVENLTLTGSGNINGTGNSAANVVTGNSGNNVLVGAGGNDTIVAGAGNDTVTGGAGADNITLGSGNDTVVYSATTDSGLLVTNVDTITDFATIASSALNGDVINLNAIDANTALLAIGNQDFTFIGTAAFTAAGQIRYVVSGADTIIQGNVNAGLGADFSIQLSGLHTLGAADFVL